MGAKAGSDPSVPEKVSTKDKDKLCAELISMALQNLSSKEVRIFILYKAALLEGLGVFDAYFHKREIPEYTKELMKKYDSGELPQPVVYFSTPDDPCPKIGRYDDRS